MFTKIDHIGIAVTDIEAEIKRYEKDYAVKVLLRENIENQKVLVAFLDLPNTTVELLAPSGKDSTLHKFLASRGPGLHHICYEVKDIVTTLKNLEDKNYKLIDKVPRHGARNSKIAFIHTSSCNGILTELCQY